MDCRVLCIVLFGVDVVCLWSGAGRAEGGLRSHLRLHLHGGRAVVGRSTVRIGCRDCVRQGSGWDLFIYEIIYCAALLPMEVGKQYIYFEFNTQSRPFVPTINQHGTRDGSNCDYRLLDLMSKTSISLSYPPPKLLRLLPDATLALLRLPLIEPCLLMPLSRLWSGFSMT